jgi:hypothetical protein
LRADNLGEAQKRQRHLVAADADPMMLSSRLPSGSPSAFLVARNVM